MPDNTQRAGRGSSALEFYGRSLLNEGRESPELDQDTLTDLLTDLLHHCDAAGLDWLYSLDRAGVNWEAERNEEHHETSDV